MPDIQAALRSYQISWLRRAVYNEEDNVWRNWLDELLLKSNGLTFNQLMLAAVSWVCQRVFAEVHNI